MSGDGQLSFELLGDEELCIEMSDFDLRVVRETEHANNVHEWMI